VNGLVFGFAAGRASALSCGANGDLMLKELPDLVEQMAMRGAEEAEIADLDKAFGQHVLQEAADELLEGSHDKIIRILDVPLPPVVEWEEQVIHVRCNAG
jgi:hypothetical protein